ncbi:MAG: AtpZ/AtpI family protein [Flavobacteriaceae bacterium]
MTALKKKKPRNFIIYSQLAFQMLVVIAGGIFLGFRLDDYFNNSNKLFTIIFSLLSISISIYYIISQVTKND